jgi:hypothetical protein
LVGRGSKSGLDNADFAGCASPKSYSNLPDGSHAFNVRATDTAGNVDATPAGRTGRSTRLPPRWTASFFIDTPGKGSSLSSASNEVCKAEEFGEERFELLRDEHAWPELLREECRVLLDELERERWERLEAQV